jgi:tetratricopeptide (TPR) repeat protein
MAARVDYATLLFSLARSEESLVQGAEALRLDPLSMRAVHDMGIAHLARGQLPQAAAKFRQGIAINPNWTWGYVKLSRVLAMQQQCPEALVQAEAAERRIAGGASPLSRSWLGVTYALCNETAKARQKLAELRALETTRYVDPAGYIDLLAALGDEGPAMEAAEKAFSEGSPYMAYTLISVRADPAFWSKPRAKAILERLNLPALGG